MKICIVCSRLSFGGAERVGVLLANGFHQVGHEVMVISDLYDPITYDLDEGILVRNLVSCNRNKLKKWMSSFKNIRKHLKEFCPDVVVGVMPTCSFAAKIATIGLDIPVIATEHNSFERPSSAPFGLWDRFLKFYLNKFYKYITVLTAADKKVIGERLKNVYVMPNPLAIEPAQMIPPKEKMILAVGRLDGWYVKGFDVLLKAWNLVVHQLKFNVRNEEWRLQVAGTGSEESLAYLKGLCKANGVEDWVDFLGFTTDVAALYQKASVFVLSSRYEGFGLVLIEAMSQGCACVACDYKGRQREIVQDDSQGLCCEPDHVEALANAIQRMITDSDYRESVRQNAIERSKFYSTANTIARWEELLSQIVRN